MNAFSTFTGKLSIQQAKRYCHREKYSVNIEQPNINQYVHEEVDRMDQNIPAYMIKLCTDKWFFDLLLMWPSIVLTKYIT